MAHVDVQTVMTGTSRRNCLTRNPALFSWSRQIKFIGAKNIRTCRIMPCLGPLPERRTLSGYPCDAQCSWLARSAHRSFMPSIGPIAHGRRCSGPPAFVLIVLLGVVSWWRCYFCIELEFNVINTLAPDAAIVTEPSERVAAVIPRLLISSRSLPITGLELSSSVIWRVPSSRLLASGR
jgi:hypothetical protein